MDQKWTKLGVDLASGGIAGAVDQFVQNTDNERAKEKAASTDAEGNPQVLNMQMQYGTYLNFGLPILDVIGVGTGFLKGDWATRLTAISGSLVGRKLVSKFSNEKHLAGYPDSDNSVGYTEWKRAKNLSANKAAGADRPRQLGKEIPTRNLMEI